MGETSIKLLEGVFDKELPVDVANFLKEHAGLSFYECLFVDATGTQWIVQAFNGFDDMYGLSNEFL